MMSVTYTWSKFTLAANCIGVLTISKCDRKVDAF